MMKIAEGLEIIELYATSMGPVSVFRPVLIWDEDTVILVDTGVPGQIQNIRAEMEKAGVPFERLNKVIITHHDLDHIGSLSSVVKESNHRVEVLSHVGERPYIQGEKMPIKMTPERIAEREKTMEGMSEEKRNDMKAMIANLPAKVDTLVQDGEELPYCGGIVVIHTPGHTPGHICLYLKRYNTLITGDALNAFEGKLIGPNPEYTANMQEAVNSLKKLVKYDIQRVICYHGGLVDNNANEKIKVLANTQL
jgi:glyoxylase-like metal-dependent hydrolase (beta-lactamase superfamily II)